MKDVKVLGSGCTNCKATTKLIAKLAAANGIEIELEKVEDVAQIAAYGIMSTPSVMIDGKIVHSGDIPSADAVTTWLQGEDTGN